jgi:glycosyltransferase involved in cell wall biosynthesis
VTRGGNITGQPQRVTCKNIENRFAVELSTEEEVIPEEVIDGLTGLGCERRTTGVRDNGAARKARGPAGTSDSLHEIHLFVVVEVGLVEESDIAHCRQAQEKTRPPHSTTGVKADRASLAFDRVKLPEIVPGRVLRRAVESYVVLKLSVRRGDVRRQHADRWITGGNPHEFRERGRVDNRVVVQDPGELGSLVERVAKSKVVPTCVAEIRAGLYEVVGTGCQRFFAAWRLQASVVDDDNALLGRRNGGERFQAGPRCRPAIPVENDEKHPRRAVVGGRMFQRHRRGRPLHPRTGYREDLPILEKLEDRIPSMPVTERRDFQAVRALQIERDASPRVLWFSHNAAIGGAEIGMHEGVQALRNRGIHASVVIPRDGPLADRLRNDGFAVFVHPYRWWMSLLPSRAGRAKNLFALIDLRARRLLAALIREARADVVITNTIAIAAPAIAARTAGVPNIWYVREYGRDDHSLEFDLGSRLSYRLIDRLSTAVVVNSHTLQAYLHEHGVRKAQVVAYAVEVPERVARPSPSSTSFQLALVGTVKPGKGHEDAVRALVQVVEAGTDAQIAFVGPTLAPYQEHISELAADLGVHDRIRFTGFLEDPFSEVAAADVCLVCSRREAFGRSTIEAMKCARPVIGAASGATAELVQHEVTGLLYSPGDVAGLAAAIVRLDRDRELLARLGEQAHDWSTARFNLARYGEDLERVVSTVLAASRDTLAQARPKRGPRR